MSVDLSKPRSSVERAYSSASSTTSSRRSGRRKRRRMKHTVMPLKRRSNRNEVACDVHRVSNLDIEEMEQSACFWVAKNIDDPSERSFKEDVFINKDQDSSADDELSCAEDFSTFDESIDLMSEEARDQSEYINEYVEKENDANYANEKREKFVYKNEDNDANYSEEKMFYGVRKGKVNQTDDLQRVTPVPLPRKKLRMSDCSDDGQSGFSSEGTGMHVGWTSDVVSSGAEYNESDGEGERKRSGLNSKEFYGYRKDNSGLAEFPTRKIRQQHVDEDTDLVVIAKDVTITESKHVSDSNHPKDIGIDFQQTDNIDENSNYPPIDDKDEFKRRHENSRYDLQPYLSSEKNKASSDTELVNFQSFDEVERWSDKSLPLGGHKTKTQYYSVEDLIKASTEEDLKEAGMEGEGPEIPRIGAYENYQPPRDTRKIDGENDVPTFENEQPEIIPNALNTQVTENRNLQENESKVIPADAYPVKYIEKEQHDSNAYLYEESKIFFGYRRKEEVNEADNQVTEETSVQNHQDNVNSYPSKDSYTSSEYDLHGPTGDEQLRNEEKNNPKSFPDDDSKYEKNKGFYKGKQEGSHRRDQSDGVYQHKDQTTRDDSKIWHETKEFYGFRKTASVESLSHVDNQGQTQKWEQNQEFYGFKQSKTGEEFASPQYKTQGSGDDPTNIFTESREFYGFRRFGSSENVSKRGGEGQHWEESREFFGFRREKIVDDQTHFAASEQLKKPQSFHQKVDTKPLYLEEAKNGSSDRKRQHENNRAYDERVKENQPNDTKSHEQQSYGPNEKQPRQEPVMKSTEQENLMLVDDSRDLEESLEFPHYTRPEDLPRSSAYEQYERPVTPLQEEPMPDPVHDEGQDDKEETVIDVPTETLLTESLPTQQSRDTIQREVSKTEEETPNSESSDVGLKMFRQRSLQRNDKKSRFSEEIGKRADKTGKTEPIAARANKLKETTRKSDSITKRSAIEKKNVEELVSVFNTLENVQKTTENSKTVDTKTSNYLGKNDDILDSVDKNIQDEETQKTFESVREPETTHDDQDKQEDVVVKREEIPVEAFAHEKSKQFPKYKKLIPYRKPRGYDSRRSRDDDDEVYRAEIRKSREDSWNQRRMSSKKNSGSKSDGEIEGFKTTFRKRVITPGTPVNIRLYGLNLQKTDQKKVFDVDWDLVDNTQIMVNENVEQTLLEKESVDMEEISDERVPVNEMMNPTKVSKSTFYLEQIPGNESVINDPYVEKHSFVIPGTDGDLSYTLPEQQKPIYLSEQQLPMKREKLPTEDNRSDIEIPIKKLHETELLKKQDSLNVDIEYDGQEKDESEIPRDNVFYEKSSLRSSTPRYKKQPSMRNEDFINGDKNYSTHEESSERYESTSHDTSDGVDTTIHTTRTTKTTRTETTETTVKTIRKSGGSQSRPSMESDETSVEIETFDATNAKDETDSRAVNDQSTKGRSVESELDYDKNKCDEPHEVSTDFTIMENGTSEPVNVTRLGRIDNNEDIQVLQSREDHFLHTRLKMISENKQANDKKRAKNDKLLEPITIYPDDVDGNNRVTEQLLIPISGNKLNENFEREHTPDIEFLQVDESTLQTRINESVHKSEKPLHSCVRRVSLTDLFERPKPHEPKLEKEDRLSKLMPDFQAVEDIKTPIFENVNSSEKPDVGIEFWEPNTNREIERIEFHPDEDESLETPPSEDIVVSLDKTLIDEQVFKERTNVATLPNFELQPVNESIVPEVRDDSFEIPKVLNEKTVEPVEEIVLASIHTSKDVSIPDLKEMRPLPTPSIVQENITSEAKEFNFEIPDFPDEMLVEPVKENVVATGLLKNKTYVPDFEEFITVLEPVKPVDESVTFERRESGLNIPEIQTPEPEQRPSQPVTEELTKNDVSIPSFSCEFEETSVEFPNVVMEQDKSFESDLEVEPPEDLSSVSCASDDIGKSNDDFEEDDNNVPVDNDKSLYEKLPPEEKPKDHLPYKDDEFEIETWSETKKTIKETHSTETVKIEKTFTKHGSKTSPTKNSFSSNKESSLSNAAHIPTLSQPKNSGDSSSEPSDRPVNVTSEVLVKRRRSRRGNRFDDIKKSGALVPETVVQDESPSVKNAKPFEPITVSKQKPLSTEPIFIPKGKSPQLRPEMYLLGSDDDDSRQDVKKLVDSSSPDEKEEMSKNSPTDEDESLAKEEISLELYDELLDNEFKGLTEQNEEIGSSNEIEVPEMIFEKDLKITTSEEPYEVKKMKTNLHRSVKILQNLQLKSNLCF
ncbi:uncharacterized protein LOC124452860 isoform X2 [Xenia sp. Carnegie-2017]|uniref:uncharacterized protein LOC124452860 isoform X2 n=1 Tax=Xenia sp. Carnegie-2017 TaxID=2897299 RepID=UPI001F0471DB|nr:uncharacterized protein LOC124452860 isoform X2 [Xenia sp. Carnegie-2017]